MIKLGLYENAIDSIAHGFDHLELAEKHKRKTDYKSAILLIFQGVELIIKELVCEKNVLYIFDKNSLFEKCNDWLNPTTEELYECRSIDINKLHATARKFYPLIFNKETENIIREAARLRNKAQHFSFEASSEEIKSILLRLYNKIISPCLTMLGQGVITGTINDPLRERIERIYCCSEVADQESRALRLIDKDFDRGSCFACGYFSLFIIHGISYPTHCYCTSCGYKKNNIKEWDLLECPECSALSLYYCEELGGGICLWHKCANHKDGGILTSMIWCDECKSYKVEDICQCNKEEDS